MEVGDKNSRDFTVFLVDDDPAVRESVSLALGMAGMVVRAFASGEAFLDAYGCDAAGCLVLDLGLPGISGLEVQQALLARQADLPVLFISGHADSALVSRARAAGAVDFLTKPFRSGELLNAVRRCLGLGGNDG